MTTEIRPVGARCNLNCSYCYLGDARRGAAPDFNADAVLSATKKAGGKFSLFGGECLLAPKPILEKLFQSGCTGLQTNGTLIDDEHIRMFRQYSIGVGVSIDGPGSLNLLRSDEETTSKVLRNVVAMRKAGVSVSVISVMHERNLTDEFRNFGLWLSNLGIPNVNCHFLQGMKHQDWYAQAFLDLAEWLGGHPELRWQPFMDIANLLIGKANEALCVWKGCDPYTTSAVYSIDPDGSVHNCARLGNWLKASEPGRERQAILAATDREHGGCKGCRFLPLCTGGCPGEAIDGDWRNRTEHCPTIRGLFRFYEDRLLDLGVMPASIGKPQPAPCSVQDRPHGDIPHGDKPYQDHTDAALNRN